ncbi:hypothetical protein BU225_20080, partial [Stenotrophomonas sp. MB339]
EGRQRGAGFRTRERGGTLKTRIDGRARIRPRSTQAEGSQAGKSVKDTQIDEVVAKYVEKAQ